MTMNAFIYAMEKFQKRVKENEKWLDKIEKDFNDQIVGDILEKNYFSEAITFAAMAVGDTRGWIKEFMAKDGRFPYTVVLNGKERSANDWKEFYCLIKEATLVEIE